MNPTIIQSGCAKLELAPAGNPIKAKHVCYIIYSLGQCAITVCQLSCYKQEGDKGRKGNGKKQDIV